MKITKLVTSIGLTVGSVLFVSNSAQAADFKSNVTQDNGAKGDVILNSITQSDQTFSNFSFVDKVEILENTERTRDKNSGAASTDKGKNASSPESTNEDPDDIEMAKFLGNNNLNNIIDTEDKGTFRLNLFFEDLIEKDDSGLDSLFFFERGMNSDIRVQAIDDAGNLLGNVIELLQKDQKDAGYKIKTTEATKQSVGSWGVSFAELGVDSLSGVQVYADAS